MLKFEKGKTYYVADIEYRGKEACFWLHVCTHVQTRRDDDFINEGNVYVGSLSAGRFYGDNNHIGCGFEFSKEERKELRFGEWYRRGRGQQMAVCKTREEARKMLMEHPKFRLVKETAETRYNEAQKKYSEAFRNYAEITAIMDGK
jgi:hypothetical protein